MLGMAVRSVQPMVDRNELQARKTPGGHRRTSRRSAEQWLRSRSGGRCLWPMRRFQLSQHVNFSGTQSCRSRSLQMGECRRPAI